MADFRLSSNTSPSKTDSISPFEEDPYIGRRGLQHQTLAASEFSQHLIDEFFNQMSQPLKRMQVEYLTNATKKCYEKKSSSSSSFTNYEHIVVCKEAERNKVFGKFDRMYQSHRATGRQRF
jgi:hypothetical protein